MPDRSDRSQRPSPRTEPVSGIARALREGRHGEAGWYDLRRERLPADRVIEPAGSLVLPKELMRGAKAIRHDAFVPPEAEISNRPRLIGARSERRLRRFSGKKVIPVNGTFLDGNDDRQLFYDASYPWACIGQMSSQNGRGTATLAGRTFVVTASHVVAGLWSANQPLTAAISFTPAMYGGKSILGPTWSANVVNIAAWEEISDVVGYDMAICQLDQPMGDWLGYFGTRAYDDDWEDNAWFEHVGYPYDMSPGGDEPCYQLDITVEDDDGDDYDTVELETDADIASGQSGGPLWAVWDDGGNQIIGVLSGNEDGFWEWTNIFAGGSGLNALVRWGRDNWG